MDLPGNVVKSQRKILAVAHEAVAKSAHVSVRREFLSSRGAGCRGTN